MLYYDTRPSMNESNSSRTQARSSDMLWGFWYPALRSEQVRRHKLVRAMLLDVPLVLGRDAAGKPFALRDVCPHRAFPLSFGQFDGKTVECAYHGWQFDAHTGQCRTIPSLTEDSKLKCDRIYAGSFPCEERDGYVWALHDQSRRPRQSATSRQRRRNYRLSAPATKSRTSMPTCPAAWTRPSSA